MSYLASPPITGLPIDAITLSHPGRKDRTVAKGFRSLGVVGRQPYRPKQPSTLGSLDGKIAQWPKALDLLNNCVRMTFSISLFGFACDQFFFSSQHTVRYRIVSPGAIRDIARNTHLLHESTSRLPYLTCSLAFLLSTTTS